MPEQFRITRIKKPGGSDNRTTHITEVYVENTTPARNPIGISVLDPRNGLLGIYQRREGWRTVESIIADIESGNEVYYTNREGKKANVIVASHQVSTNFGGQRINIPLGRKYIKTEADSTLIDNLLSLPNDYGK